jgi:hypothetical protein
MSHKISFVKKKVNVSAKKAQYLVFYEFIRLHMLYINHYNIVVNWI